MCKKATDQVIRRRIGLPVFAMAGWGTGRTTIKREATQSMMKMPGMNGTQHRGSQSHANALPAGEPRQRPTRSHGPKASVRKVTVRKGTAPYQHSQTAPTSSSASVHQAGECARGLPASSLCGVGGCFCSLLGAGGRHRCRFPRLQHLHLQIGAPENHLSSPRSCPHRCCPHSRRCRSPPLCRAGDQNQEAGAEERHSCGRHGSLDRGQRGSGLLPAHLPFPALLGTTGSRRGRGGQMRLMRLSTDELQGLNGEGVETSGSGQ